MYPIDVAVLNCITLVQLETNSVHFPNAFLLSEQQGTALKAAEISIVQTFNSILASKSQSSICCTVGHCVRDSQRKAGRKLAYCVLLYFLKKLPFIQFLGFLGSLMQMVFWQCIHLFHCWSLRLGFPVERWAKIADCWLISGQKKQTAGFPETCLLPLVLPKFSLLWEFLVIPVTLISMGFCKELPIKNMPIFSVFLFLEILDVPVKVDAIFLWGRCWQGKVNKNWNQLDFVMTNFGEKLLSVAKLVTACDRFAAWT